MALRFCWRLRRCGIRALCTAATSPLYPPLLTTALRQHLARLAEEYQGLQDKASTPNAVKDRTLYQRMSSLEPVVKLLRCLEAKEKDMMELQELLEGCEGEGEIKALAGEEQKTCYKEIQQVEKSILGVLVPKDNADEQSAILEVRAGAGGKEASLFTAEVFLMYQKFSAYKQWKFEVLETDTSDGGGFKHASASLNGTGVFGVMKHESGVHRVQRIPATEGGGRVHTSTMSVAILPQPSEIDVEVSPSDLRIETTRSSGPGGQSVNTTDSAVRITHIPSGIAVRIEDDRSQHKNRSRALKILRAKLYEIKRSEAEIERRRERKEQVGSGERHERIRTYHYLQDRVTDHRLNASVHGIDGFLEGEQQLENLMEQLQVNSEAWAISKLLTTHKK